MAITLNSAAPNNADWKTTFQFNDAETGDLLDFTGASIEIEVRDFDGCLIIEATTGNGKILITGLGVFELDIPSSEMQNICPGTYPVGGVYQLNGDTISLFTGALAVTSGVARI